MLPRWWVPICVMLLLAACSGPSTPDSVQAGVTTAVASGSDGEHVASNTLDGDYETRWSAEGRAGGDGDSGPWIIWQLDGAYELEEATIAFHAGDNGNPTSFHLDVSVDGRDWDRAVSATASGRTVEGEAFPFEPQVARYVRYVGEGRESSAWNSITVAKFEGVRLDTAPETQDPGSEASNGPPAGANRGTEASETVSHGEQLGARHVGVTATDSLTPSGPVVTTRDGQVIERLEIHVGGREQTAVVVRHDDVVVRDNRLRFPDGAQGIHIDSEASGALVEHNELDAVRLSESRQGTTSSNNNVGQRGIHVRGPDAVIRRNHLVFVRSAIRIVGDRARVEENLVSELADAAEDSPGGGSLHGTSISLPGDAEGVVVARNRVLAGQSGGIVLYAQGGPLIDIAVLDNLVVGRGDGFGLYGGRTHVEQGHFVGNSGLRIEGNRFEGVFGFPDVVGEGTNAGVDLSRPGNTFDGNRWVSRRGDLVARCGITSDECED
jgi:hypothetical protein